MLVGALFGVALWFLRTQGGLVFVQSDDLELVGSEHTAETLPLPGHSVSKQQWWREKKILARESRSLELVTT